MTVSIMLIKDNYLSGKGGVRPSLPLPRVLSPPTQTFVWPRENFLFLAIELPDERAQLTG